ncbi:MAG: FG-GAP-like repeat-containing protein [Bacteroidota bacterium]
MLLWLVLCIVLFSSPLRAQVFTVQSTNLPAVGASSQTVDVRSADLDGDGDPDLVLANEFQANGILLNDGNGAFTNGIGILPPIIQDTDDLVIADFDQDGDADIIFVSEDNFGHEYYVNQGNLLFTQGPFLPFSKGTAIVTGDLNGDAFPDLLIGNLYQQNMALINDGTGGFINETPERLPEFNDGTYDLKLIDVDGDDDDDLFVANQDGNKLFVNNGDGIFTDETALRLPQGIMMDTRKVSFGDIDGDDDMDLFLANVEFILGSDPQNRIYINDGNGFFLDVTATYLPALNDQTTEGLFFDFDEDGDLDLFVSNVLHNPLIVYRNNGQGVFTDFTADLLGGSSLSLDAWGLLVEDFNDDNFVDIYVCNRTGKDVYLEGDKEALLSSDDQLDLAALTHLFPNPVRDQFILELPAAIGSNPVIQLNDWSGRQQVELNYTQQTAHRFSFDLSGINWPNGNYLLTVQTNEHLVTQKLTILRP